jgi:hypothetical protein
VRSGGRILFTDPITITGLIRREFNCLDHDKTEWEYGETTGKPIRIVRYAFHEDRMPESSIFKIPETGRSEILCYEGARDPEDEFKPFVERNGITGLKFTELWSSA